MAMESLAAAYPLLFNDGEKVHDMGVIGVHSFLCSKKFLANVSQKTGHSANELSLVLVCKHHKLPINGNTDFNLILSQHNPIHEEGCHFLVSLKMSAKKGRRGRAGGGVTPRKPHFEAGTMDEDSSISCSSARSSSSSMLSSDEDSSLSIEPPKLQFGACAAAWISDNSNSKPPFEKILLRRSALPNGISPKKSISTYSVHPLASQRCDNHIHQEEAQHPLATEDALQRSCEETNNPQRISMLRHTFSSVSSSDLLALKLRQAKAEYLDLHRQQYVQMQRSCETLLKGLASTGNNLGKNNSGVCSYCDGIKERKFDPTSFHLCVHDEVTTGFKGPSPAGAVGTPVKRLLAAA